MLKKALYQKLQSTTNTPPHWLQNLRLVDDGTVLRVLFPHSYFRDYFEQYRADFEAALADLLPEPTNILYEVPNTAVQLTRRQRTCAPRRGASPGCTFENFFHNAKNTLAVASAQQFVTNDNVLLYLLYGITGTGKSHLLKAMQHCLIASQKRVFAASAAQIQKEQLWREYPAQWTRAYDALVIDDAHLLFEDPQYHQPVISLLDLAETAGKKIVFALTGTTRLFADLPPMLRTRLERGLVNELLPPDIDVRLKYIQSYCQQNSLALNQELYLFLAQRCPHIRFIQGIFQKISVFFTAYGHLPAIEELNSIMFASGVRRQTECRDIIAAVARHYAVRVEDLLGDKRLPQLVLARQIAMYICRHSLGLSYPELGKAFGGKDHSTVIHAVKKIRKIIVSDKSVQALVATIETKNME